MNGAAHKLGGGIAGGGVSLFTAQGQTGLEVLIETLAGIGGGVVGAKIPDWMEPAISSWHRGPVHSFAAAGAISTSGIPAIRDWQESCKRHVEGLRVSRAMARTPDEVQRYTLEIFFWLALVAFVKGLLAGYLSHLALDATTPRCIPLLC